MNPTKFETQPPVEPEPFFTIKEAAALLNLKYWALLRAANSGLVPSYTFINSRRFVRLSEIVAAMEGGNHE